MSNNNISELIKQMALDAMDAVQPCSVFFGTVTQESPLEITTEQKLLLKRDFLTLTKNVTDYETNVEVSWSAESATLNANHSHELEPDTDTMVLEEKINLMHSHNVSGNKIKILNGLKQGDKVMLLQKQGGQEFIVLDKIY